MHTRLLTRAREWDARERDGSFLLRGADLRERRRGAAPGAGRARGGRDAGAYRLHRRESQGDDAPRARDAGSRPRRARRRAHPRGRRARPTHAGGRPGSARRDRASSRRLRSRSWAAIPSSGSASRWRHGARGTPPRRFARCAARSSRPAFAPPSTVIAAAARIAHLGRRLGPRNLPRDSRRVERIRWPVRGAGAVRGRRSRHRRPRAFSAGGGRRLHRGRTGRGRNDSRRGRRCSRRPGVEAFADEVPRTDGGLVERAHDDPARGARDQSERALCGGGRRRDGSDRERREDRRRSETR